MDVARGSRKPAGQIAPHFEHGSGCLLNSTGISWEGDEKRERARDPAEGLCGAHQSSVGIKVPRRPTWPRERAGVLHAPCL